MADVKITALTAISANPVNPATFPIPMVDLLDNTITASGTTKKVTVNQILGAGGTATLASATITGAATVGTTLGVTGVSTFAAGTALLPALTTTGDTNTGIYYPAADTFAVTTGGTERYRVDSSGNLLIGTSTALGKVRVRGGSGQNFVVDVSNSNQVSLQNYGSTGDGGWQELNLFASPITFSTGTAGGTSGAERARFNSTGNLAFANGLGIDFSAVTGGTGTATANVLNDYEEGTWTPVVADATTGGNVGTCVINHARYTKIGRQVSVECNISSITSTGMTGGNPLYVRSLPFASVTGGNGNFYSLRVGRNASTVSSSVFCLDGTSYVYFPLYTTNSATTGTFILVSDIVSGTSEIILSVTYYV